ncbi:MAG: fibronectin type III domain-containing protein [bacterium]|nr:fibronectin type III domain-containing protein [bacterium]
MQRAVYTTVLVALLLSPAAAGAAEDILPPLRSELAPRGGLFGGERNVELSLKTDRSAECRFGSAGGEAFLELDGVFATTSGATLHRAVVKSLRLGESYMFAVRCRDSSGNVNADDAYIAFSITAPVDGGDFTRPAPPPDFRAHVLSEVEIELTWAASVDNNAVTRYRLYRCSGGYCTPVETVATPTTTAYRDSGLVPHTYYRYHVTAIDSRSNESLRSLTAAATTTLGVREEAGGAQAVQSTEASPSAAGGVAVATSSAQKSTQNRAELLIRQIRALIRQLTRLLAQYGALLQNR